MKFKLDENLGQRGQEILRAAGHDFSSVPEQGMQESGDADLIEHCRAEGRCLVTLDYFPESFPTVTRELAVSVLRCSKEDIEHRAAA